MGSKYPWFNSQDTEILELLHKWEKEDAEGQRKPTEILKRIAENVEARYEQFLHMSPDPFDDRHPSAAYPECRFGHILRLIVGEKEFMDKLTTSYFINSDSDFELNCQAARLLVDIMSGMEGKIFEDWESVGKMCYLWAKSGKEPLRTYAIDMIAVGMHTEENAGIFKEENQALGYTQKEHNEEISVKLPLMKTEFGRKGLYFLAAKEFNDLPLQVPMVLRRLRCLKEISDLNAPAIQNFSKFSSKAGTKGASRHIRYSAGKTQKKREDDSSQGTPKSKQIEVKKSPQQIVDRQNGEIAETGRVEETKEEGKDGKDSKPRPSQSAPHLSGRDSNQGPNHSGVHLSGKDSTPGSSQSAPHFSGRDPQPGPSHAAVHSNPGPSHSPLHFSGGEPQPGPSHAPVPSNPGPSHSAVPSNPGPSHSAVPSNPGPSHSPLHFSGREPQPGPSHAAVPSNPGPSHSAPRFSGREPQPGPSHAAVHSNPSKGPQSGPSHSEVPKHIKETRAARSKRQVYKEPKYSLWPLDVGTQQKSLLSYLTALGQYQELLIYAFECDALDLIFYYINPKAQKDPVLALRGCEYLASLMCHKKFVAEFVKRGGVQKFLEIPHQSMSSTGMSLCVYYLGYSSDAMEKVCLLPHPLLSELVKYTLWFVDSGTHESSRSYATLFFAQVFSFRAILELFVSMDGLRRLVNTITILTILRPEESRLMTNDEAFGMRQTIKHTLIALRKFFDAQLAIKADDVRRKIARKDGGLPPPPIPAYKSMTITFSQHTENVKLLLDNSAEVSDCMPVTAFKKLGGIQLLFQIIALASSEWDGYGSRNEVVRMALDILGDISVSPKVQLGFCQNVCVSTDDTQSGIRILVRAADGELIKGDGEIQKIALQAICNCVCGPKPEVIAASARSFARPMRVEDVVHKMWNAIRLQNGMKVLLSLLHAKKPVLMADEIRCLACKALCGLSRSDRIRQVLQKLMTILGVKLQMLMREPVLPDKMNEHFKFCVYASELIEMVTGKVLAEHWSPMARLSTLKKSDIVSQTQISYSEKELLQLIVDHLKSQGLRTSATALQREAFLKGCVSTDSETGLPFLSPVPSRRRMSFGNHRSHDLLLTPGDSTPRTPSVYRPESETQSDRLLDLSRTIEPQPSNSYFQPTLDKIVRNYLREQHAHCRNPVTTCPEFSLVRPHQCPEPQYRTHAPTDMTRRIFKRQIKPRHGGRMGCKLNRKFIFSRFRSVGTIGDADTESFTCAKFLPDGDLILLGTKNGELKMYNIFTGLEEASYSCHQRPIHNCEPSKDLKLLLTSSSFSQPSSALWTFFDSQFFEMKQSFADDDHIKFSSAQDQLVGTKDHTAHIYDLSTGKLISTLSDPNNANRYHKNFATFNQTDDLIMNDGCLWDVRAAKLLHKFDKFNDFVSGVFHPSGLEIVINSEIWDIRTFHLLDTCTALDQCKSIFNGKGDIIYGVKHVAVDAATDFILGSNFHGPFDSTFTTFDAYDYSVIATTDSKKTILDLCPDNNDALVAVVEGSLTNGDIESVCRVYEIGRMKKIEGEDSDEEQMEEEETEEAPDEDEDEFDDAMDTLEDLLLDVGDEIEDDDYDDDDEDEDDDDDDNDDDDDDSIVRSLPDWAYQDGVDESDNASDDSDL